VSGLRFQEISVLKLTTRDVIIAADLEKERAKTRPAAI
jgi:hypothetical protein